MQFNSNKAIALCWFTVFIVLFVIIYNHSNPTQAVTLRDLLFLALLEIPIYFAQHYWTIKTKTT